MLRGYFTIRHDGSELTVYIERKMDSYMGRPLFNVWHGSLILLVCDLGHLQKQGLKEAPYPYGMFERSEAMLRDAGFPPPY